MLRTLLIECLIDGLQRSSEYIMQSFIFPSAYSRIHYELSICIFRSIFLYLNFLISYKFCEYLFAWRYIFYFCWRNLCQLRIKTIKRKRRLALHDLSCCLAWLFLSNLRIKLFKIGLKLLQIVTFLILWNYLENFYDRFFI